MTTFDRSRLPDCGQMELFPTSSVAAGPVSPTASPEPAKAAPTSAISGPNSPASFARLGPGGYWEKTCLGYSQLTLDGSSETFSETWPRSGTMRSGIAYPQVPSAPLTYGTGYGSSPTHSIPTPTASDCIERQCTSRQSPLNFGTPLAVAVRMPLWPTPTRGDGDSSGSRNTPNSQAHPGLSLTDAVRQDGGTGRMWPTPTASEQNISSQQAETRIRTNGICLQDAVRRWPTPTAEDGESKGMSMQRLLSRPPDNLATAVRWSTPTTRDAESLRKTMRGQGSLERGNQIVEPLAVQAAKFPSPAARDWRSGRGRQENGHTRQLPEVVGAQLNPDWVELLLGLPKGFTRLGDRDGKMARPASSPARRRSRIAASG